MASLITGRAGSGKSTICQALKRRGYEAFDADEIPGLCAWIDLKTGRVTSVDYTKYVDYSQVGWNWNADILQSFLKAHPQAIICGSASNQLEFYELFTKIIVLRLDPRIHQQRLQTRASTYAKDPRQIAEILDEQQALVKESVARGATAVNAGKTSKQLIDELAELL